MAFNAGAVEGEVRLQVKDFLDSIKRMNQSLDNLEKESKEATEGVSKFERGIGLLRDAIIILPAAFNALTAPVRALVGFLSEASSQAADFQQVTQELAVSLALMGSKGVQGTVDSLKEYASLIQDTTAFSDDMVLRVSQTLSVLGVQEDQLQESTKAVLDFAAATGTDAQSAAEQFGRTMSGMAGQLARYFPAVRSLTEEQLKAGDAFKLVTNTLGGFSEQVANTSKGLRAQLANAFADLQKEVGFAINPVIDALVRGATTAVKSVTEVISANKGSLTEALAGVAEGALGVFEGLVDRALDLPAMLQTVRLFIADLVNAFSGASDSIRMKFQEMALLVREEFAALAEDFSGIPFFGDALSESAEKIRAGIAATRVEIDAAAVAAAAHAKEEEGARQAIEAARDAALAQADAIRSGTDTASTLAVVYQGIKGAIDATRAGLQSVNQQQQQLAVSGRSYAAGLNAALERLRGINGTTQETAQAARAVAENTSGATEATRQLAEAASAASDEFESMADSAGSIGGGGGGGGGGGADSFGRHSGGSAGYDTSTIAGTQAALSSAQSALGRQFGGLFSRQQRQSTRSLVDTLSATLRAQTQEALAEFTSQVVDELNRAGVYDAAERERTIQQRLQEARRLGVLPSTSTSQASVKRIAFA